MVQPWIRQVCVYELTKVLTRIIQVLSVHHRVVHVLYTSLHEIHVASWCSYVNFTLYIHAGMKVAESVLPLLLNKGMTNPSMEVQAIR